MNYKMVLSYDGSAYHGWAIQPNVNTIQGSLVKIFNELFNLQPQINASGRTDAGVHAIAQVINVKDSRLNIKPEELMNALNSRLPLNIRVKECLQVKEQFHARYFVKEKTYLYVINCHPQPDAIFQNYFYQYNKPIDVNHLQLLIPYFKKKQNFLSFSTSSFPMDKCIRTISKIEFKKQGQYFLFRITADGFLRSMVRMIVGTFLAYNENKISIQEIIEAFNNPLKGKIAFKVPGCGLYLEEVYYNDY